MTYEDFFPAADVAAYKRVKRGTMLLARAGRSVACAMVCGSVADAGKEFVHTRRGVFRLSMGHNSDNTTETLAHDRMGATPVVMGDDAELGAFFASHGLEPAEALAEFKARVMKLVAPGSPA